MANKFKYSLVILFFLITAVVNAQMKPGYPGWKKAAKGSAEILGIEAVTSAILFLSPEEFSHWPDPTWSSVKSNLKRAYTSPPVWDHDHWVINYAGHPYMGAYFFNSVRSQGCSFLASAGMCVAHTFIWEYVIEASMEQPSINDLIITPLSGMVLGEGIHRLTLYWKRGGFTVIEKIGTAILNPLYVINNGFR